MVSETLFSSHEQITHKLPAIRLLVHGVVGGPETLVPVAGKASHFLAIQIVRPIAKSYSRRESDSFPK